MPLSPSSLPALQAAPAIARLTCECDPWLRARQGSSDSLSLVPAQPWHPQGATGGPASPPLCRGLGPAPSCPPPPHAAEPACSGSRPLLCKFCFARSVSEWSLSLGARFQLHLPGRHPSPGNSLLPCWPPLCPDEEPMHIFIIVFVALHPFTRQLLTECSRHGRRLMPLTRDRWVCDRTPHPSWSSRRGPGLAPRSLLHSTGPA